jgi:hypothetical protein
MKYYDYNEKLGLSLVSDDDGSNTRYERIKPRGTAPLEPSQGSILRQRHYVANAVAQGLVIVGSRIKMVPADWVRLGSDEAFKRAMGAMT